MKAPWITLLFGPMMAAAGGVALVLWGIKAIPRFEPGTLLPIAVASVTAVLGALIWTWGFISVPADIFFKMKMISLGLAIGSLMMVFIIMWL